MCFAYLYSETLNSAKNFFHCDLGKNILLGVSILNYFSIMQYVNLAVTWSGTYYLHRSLCSILMLYLSQVLHLKTILMKSLFVSRNLYYFQSTICHLHKVLEILFSSHLLSWIFKHFCFPDEIKLFWPFHQNENSNSIMLASVYHWISEVLHPSSILRNKKNTQPVSHRHP